MMKLFCSKCLEELKVYRGNGTNQTWFVKPHKCNTVNSVNLKDTIGDWIGGHELYVRGDR